MSVARNRRHPRPSLHLTSPSVIQGHTPLRKSGANMLAQFRQRLRDYCTLTRLGTRQSRQISVHEEVYDDILHIVSHSHRWKCLYAMMSSGLKAIAPSSTRTM